MQTLGANIWVCARTHAQAFENAHALCEYTEGCGAKTETRTAVYVYNVDSVVVSFPDPHVRPPEVWNLSQDFLALLNQHDDVYYVIQNDCHVIWAYGPIPLRAYHLAIGIGTERCSSTH